jgi:hypothetical protein
MPLTEELKKRIDEMSYMQLLRIWRFHPAGHYLFVGEVGDYFSNRFFEVQRATPPGQRVAASKAIGW